MKAREVVFQAGERVNWGEGCHALEAQYGEGPFFVFQTKDDGTSIAISKTTKNGTLIYNALEHTWVEPPITTGWLTFFSTNFFTKS